MGKNKRELKSRGNFIEFPQMGPVWIFRPPTSARSILGAPRHVMANSASLHVSIIVP
jgi:hypothetical protein